MGGLKAPSPDGFQGVFYHTFWENIVGDVNSLVRSLIHGQDSPSKLNSTHIVLIPKVQNPEMNAFVRGRQIQDNIGIAHEVFHFQKVRKAKRRFDVGIKLDMQKAYDRVEWDFLDAVMERMGFGILWIKLIMGCVSSVNFAVILNGQPSEKFAPSRGLRQGDPLSPYLFLLADRKNCNNLVDLLKDYCTTSGQAINMQKSSVFFETNIPSTLSKELGNILGMTVVENPGTYLGVPAIWGRSKRQGLAYVKGRIVGKLQGWKQSMLSKAGK
ncbi:hypothetical protein ACFXTN_026319 [Malus domestica]